MDGTSNKETGLLLGNCLICAVILWTQKGGKIRKVRTKHGDPHYYLLTPDRERWHFTAAKHFFPGDFLYWLLFWGKFEKLTSTRLKKDFTHDQV
jgi:hypothetical protein